MKQMTLNEMEMVNGGAMSCDALAGAAAAILTIPGAQGIGTALGLVAFGCWLGS
jgi:hypothetical protein